MVCHRQLRWGLLGGDEVDMAVEVDSNATLTLVTQDPQVTKS